MGWKDLVTALAIALGAIVALITLCRAIYNSRIAKAEEAAEWKGRTDESVGHLKTSLKNIEDYLRGLFEQRLQPVSKGNSPVQLTELGKSVSEHLGAKEWAREEAGKLQPKFQGQEPFEVYEAAQQYVRDDSQFSPEFQRKMRRTAYEKSVEMVQIQAVLAIELRDALVERMAD